MASSGPSPITSQPPRFSFTDRFIQAPGQNYIDNNDRLVVEATSSVVATVFRVQLRILRPGEGILEWRQDIKIEAFRVTQVSVFALPEGFLLGLDVSTPEIAVGGSWNYAQVGLARGPGGTPDVFHGLAQGYIDGPYSLFWPGGVYRLPSDGVGLSVISPSLDPAAGAEAAVPVRSNAAWLLRNLTITLVTDATAVSRRFGLKVTRSGGTILKTASGTVQNASLTFDYHVASWGESGGDRNGQILVNWPADFRLRAGDIITTETALLQAGDNFSAIRVTVDEWFQRTA